MKMLSDVQKYICFDEMPICIALHGILQDSLIG